MVEFKCCSNPSCCEYTSNFLEGNTECIKCMSYEPKIRRPKRYKKTIIKRQFTDHQMRVKEEREREREKRRKQKRTEIFF